MNVLNKVIKNDDDYSRVINQANETKRKKLVLSSIAGSAAGITCAVAGIYKSAKKANPSITLKNLSYKEKDILLIGAGSIIGGLTGGCLADNNKENKISKVREGLLQFFGNLACPLGLLNVSNNLLEKSKFKLPEFRGTSKPIKAINTIIKALPKITVTAVSLVAGMHIGNRIMNKVNNKLFNQQETRDVHASDYLVHIDDICIASSLILKDSSAISNITSKVLPVSFIVAGTKTGMKNS